MFFVLLGESEGGIGGKGIWVALSLAFCLEGRPESEGGRLPNYHGIVGHRMQVSFDWKGVSLSLALFQGGSGESEGGREASILAMVVNVELR